MMEKKEYYLQYRRFSVDSIKRLIDDIGLSVIANDTNLYSHIASLAKLDDNRSGDVSRYLWRHVRYYQLKNKIVKAESKRDKFLLKEGPDVPPKKEVIKKEVEDAKVINISKNLSSVRKLLPYVKHTFEPHYIFTCKVCESKKRNGMGFSLEDEDYICVCDRCIDRYHIHASLPHIIYTPMGGQNRS